jgi:hypothetical protein
MTKLETIIKAWADLDIKTPFGICNNTGYFISYCVNGIDDIISEYPTIKNKIDFEYSEYDLIKWRPKSLKGIENNNGWIKIETEADLPTDKTIQYSTCKDKKVFQSTVNCGTVKHWFNICKITHYQPIKKQEPPLF